MRIEIILTLNYNIQGCFEAKNRMVVIWVSRCQKKVSENKVNTWPCQIETGLTFLKHDYWETQDP